MQEATVAAQPDDERHVRRIRIGIWCGVLALVIIYALLAPALSANISFAFYLLMWITLATSFNFIAGMTGYMPFGYVAFYGVGAYAAGIVYRSFGLPMGAALLACVIASVALALLMAPTLRLRSVYFGIVSLALAMAAKLVVSLLPEHISGGSMGLILASANNPKAAFACMAVLAVLALLTGTWLAFSRTGVALRAIRDDPGSAATIGIDVPRERIKAWVLAAVFPALAGAIEAWYSNAIDLEASFSLLVSVKTIVYSMAGGLGTLIGPVLGAVVLFGVDQVVWSYLPTLNMLVLGLIIIALVMFLPSGIVGTLQRRYSRLRKYVP